jgi:hypothetical protein
MNWFSSVPGVEPPLDLVLIMMIMIILFSLVCGYRDPDVGLECPICISLYATVSDQSIVGGEL